MSEIAAAFFDKAFRERWLDEQIRVGLATQIREMRVGRGWTQEDLGHRIGVTQERVSNLEDPSYGRYTVKTLQRIAAVFDVALILRFGPWNCVLTGKGFDWTARIPSFDEEFGSVAHSTSPAEGET